MAVGWERRETGACRSGVGRGNQEGGGGAPPLFSSQRCTPSPFYHLALSLSFQLLFPGRSRRSRPSDKKSTGRKKRAHTPTHTHLCVLLGKPLAAYATTRGCAFLPHPTQKPNYTKHLPDGAGRHRQAARKKIVHSVWRPRPPWGTGRRGPSRWTSKQNNAQRDQLLLLTLVSGGRRYTSSPPRECGTAEQSGW